MGFFKRIFGTKDTEEKEREWMSTSVEQQGSKTVVKMEINSFSGMIESVKLERRKNEAENKVDLLYEWRVGDTHAGKRKRPCSDCRGRDGQIEQMEQWELIGLPQSGFSVCGGACTCQLVQVGEYRWRGDETLWYEEGYRAEEGGRRGGRYRAKALIMKRDNDGRVRWEEAE